MRGVSAGFDGQPVVSSPLRWVIVTGEYPPQNGGVADYTRLLARALADSGDDVRIVAPRCDGQQTAEPGVSIYRLRDHFGVRGLLEVNAYLRGIPRPYTMLVQYVPQSFGWKGLNLPAALWLLSRRREAVWVMFHEVCTPLAWGQPVSHTLLGIGTRIMASAAVRAAGKSYVSTPAWRRLLATLAPPAKSIGDLPVASNLPVVTDRAVVARLRRELASRPGSIVVGHFGTYGDLLRPMLEEVLPDLLSQTDAVACLIGRRSDSFADSLGRRHPDLVSRIIATGEVAPEIAAVYISACDMLIQPYPDGVTTRRGSLMAAIALGRPVITTDGPNTEEIWRVTGAVALASEPAEIVKRARAWMENPEERARAGMRAASAYARYFSIERTVCELRTAASKTTWLQLAAC